MARPPTTSRIALPAFFSAQAALDDVAVVGGEGDGVGVAEEVGGVQQVDVQGVAGDPLPAVEQSAQRADPLVDDDPAYLLDGLPRAGLVGHRADPADARGDVADLRVLPPAQEGFEEPRRLVDLQIRPLHLAVLDDDPQRALAFDARERADVQFPIGGHRTAFVRRVTWLRH